MQIILSKEACKIIYEALITEHAEAEGDRLRDKQRGRDLQYVDKRIKGIKGVLKRFEPYVEN